MGVGALSGQFSSTEGPAGRALAVYEGLTDISRLDAVRRQRLALATGVGVIAVWASAFTIQKQVYAAMSASGFLFARYLLLPLIAALLLCW